MKKVLCLAICLAILATAFCGCGNDYVQDGKLKVVATIFPEYDWVREIMGDAFEDADVVLLQYGGTDMHSYQPTAADIIKISECDIFIYVGGVSDDWVKDALKEKKNKEMTEIELLKILGENALKEEIKDGMEGEEQHDHDNGPELDEHVWLSLRNAEVFCEKIAQALKEKDPENADKYEANFKSYAKKLSVLEEKYAYAVQDGKDRVLVFADRFPFRYLADDYSLDYYAAFAGCSSETAASFETITKLAAKVDELGVSAVMTIEGSDCKLAETVIANTKTKDQKILTLDSMQSATTTKWKDATYLSIMEKNLDVLIEAMGKWWEE